MFRGQVTERGCSVLLAREPFLTPRQPGRALFGSQQLGHRAPEVVALAPGQQVYLERETTEGYMGQVLK